MLSLEKAVSTMSLMPFLLLEKSKRLISQGRGEQGESRVQAGFRKCVESGDTGTQQEEAGIYIVSSEPVRTTW